MHPYYYLVLLFLIGSILILWATGGGHGGHIYQRGNWFLSIDFPVIRLQRENIQNRPYFNHRQLFKRWFRLGAFVSQVIIVPSLVLLVNNLWTVVNRRVLLIWGSGGSGAGQTLASTQPVLQVVLPGYNLPLSDLGYYVITLFAVTVFHEWGHAAAARAEGIQVLEYGLVFCGPVPMAYVNLPTRDLETAPIGAKLRVMTAGVWHNIVLAVAAFLLLTTLPWISLPLYKTGHGLVITEVAANSVVLGPSGLERGDVMTSLNGCDMKSIKSFRDCFVGAIRHQVGWCAFQNGHTQDNLTECSNRTETDQHQMCFSLELPDGSLAFTNRNVRQLLDGAEVCDTNKTCSIASYSCLRPAAENLTQIRRENARDFLFVGDPTEIYYDIQVSEYQSRINTSLMNSLPPKLEKLLYYFVILSSALAALNAVPCWRLDGCLTLAALINHLQIIGPRTKPKLVRGLTHLGTALLVANMALGVLDLIL